MTEQDRDDWAPWLANLELVGLVNDQTERRRQAKSLLRAVASALQCGRPLPQEISDWLATALSKAAGTGNANVAFGLSPGSGQRSNQIEHLVDAAKVFAIVHWFGVSKQKAFQEIESLSRRSESDLSKRYRACLRKWGLSGPFLTDEQSEATPDHLATGQRVVVVFRSKTVSNTKVVIYLPVALARIALSTSKGGE